MRNKENNPHYDWHTLNEESIANQLNTDLKAGLSEKEAASRLEEHGYNALPEPSKQPAWIRFLKHFNDILIYILLIAAIVTALLGHYVDTIVIVIVAIVNATIGFFQENKAEKALEDIKKLLSHTALVIRDGKRHEIPAEELTIGDLVLLNPGDKVPADLRIIQENNLQIEESALTGESVPSEKYIEPLPEDTELGDRVNMAFSSTTVTAGTGLGIVVAVSENTEIGKINRMLSDVKTVTTPLLKQTAKFGTAISLIIVIVSVLVFAFGYFFRSYDTTELLMSVIGLAVAAIPEGLPAILSIILAIGVQNMAKQKAIIRTLPSVETLGSVSVICSDKTGTLTRNEMTVKNLVTSDQHFTVTGSGYSSEGQIINEKETVDMTQYPVMKDLINCFYYCNDSALGYNKEGNLVVKGDPTEGALLTLYNKSGLEKDDTERLATIPFDSAYKYMATLMAWEDRKVIFIKGAPDTLIQMASKQRTAKGEEAFDKAFWHQQIESLASRGMRTIGAAIRVVDKEQTTLSHDDVCGDITFLGIAGIIDPPREEAIQAIAACHKAGIRVKMITGDHVITAKAIGKEMGIGDGEKALQGKDLEKMSDKEFEQAVMEYDIFARTTPEHKLRLVEALQRNDVICAMTGDGVNDAPALKKADVGIAMGIKGTEVTKDAADMVLTDDNFSTIVDAVREGRRVYDNLKKTILFILPTNGAESFLIMVSIIFGTMIPLIPVQILWVNMVTSITISLALAFEKIEPNAMKRPPRPANSPLLSKYFIWRILFVSVLIGGGTLIMNLSLLSEGVSEITVKTITLNTIVIAQMFHLFNNRTYYGFAFNKDFFSNKMVFIVSVLLVVLQLAITYLPFMNSAFQTVPLELAAWRYPVVLGILVFIIVELEKFIVSKLR